MKKKIGVVLAGCGVYDGSEIHEAVITLLAIDRALGDIQNKGESYPVPDHLKDAHYKDAKKYGYGVDYKYPHDYPDHTVEQEYLPI